MLSRSAGSVGSKYWKAFELVKQAAELVGVETVKRIADGLKFSSRTSIELCFCEKCLYPGYAQNVAATRVYDIEGYYTYSTWEGEGELVCPECGGSIARLYVPYDTFQKLEALLIDTVPEKLRQAKLVAGLILQMVGCADLDLDTAELERLIRNAAEKHSDVFPKALEAVKLVTGKSAELEVLKTLL